MHPQVHIIGFADQYSTVGYKSEELIEARDSRTGYLLPARDGPGALPDMDSSWDVAAIAAAVSCQNVT